MGKSLFPLPGKRIELDGNSYFVHGMVHDAPLVLISKDFKKTISNLLRGYNVICEDGFTSWVKNAESFREISYFRFDKVRLLDIVRWFFYFNYRKLTDKNEPQIILNIREMKSLEDFYLIHDELIKSYPSEPEGINDLISRACGGTIDNPKGELPLRVKRYLYEAKKSLEYVEEKGIKELHILVGCRHELPLEYLLTNKSILDNLVITH